MSPLAASAAEAIHDSFRFWFERFESVTRRARERFERRDWDGMQSDTRERLDLHDVRVIEAVAVLHGLLGSRLDDERLWREIHEAYARSIARDAAAELAETFFNSVVHRVFGAAGVNPAVEFLDAGDRRAASWGDDGVARFDGDEGLEPLFARVLAAYRPACGWADAARDASRAAARLRGTPLGSLELLRPVFYRNEGAYLVGRAVAAGRSTPLVLALAHGTEGVHLDAVLTDESEISVVFSFTRSYFHVEGADPGGTIAFLRTLLPRKPVAELYISLGFHKHGKTETYRALERHLRASEGRFVHAPGAAGMVMIVFTLPDYDLVFKVIRDVFAPPKSVSRDEVLRHYRLVFEHDRVGRLVDAQEFEHLKFPRDRFHPDLLRELAAEASKSVVVEGDDVLLLHLYTERRVTPLNLHIRQAGRASVEAAVVDYGLAIKELAAANVFPGDFLPKNFGVTRHGRVVFYDYDELCLLTDCRFREIPEARDMDDALQPEPWFAVGPNDVFPEEFPRFLGLPPDLLELFRRHHADLFTADYWRGLQARHRAGDYVPVAPYPAERRLFVAP